MINLILPITFVNTSRSINKKDEQVNVVHIYAYDYYNTVIPCVLENDKVVKSIKEISELYNIDIKYINTIPKCALYYIDFINTINTSNKLNIIRYNDIFIKNIKILKKIANNNSRIFYLSRISIVKNFIIPSKFPNKWHVGILYSSNSLDTYNIIDEEES